MIDKIQKDHHSPESCNCTNLNRKCQKVPLEEAFLMHVKIRFRVAISDGPIVLGEFPGLTKTT